MFFKIPLGMVVLLLIASNCLANNSHAIALDNVNNSVSLDLQNLNQTLSESYSNGTLQLRANSWGLQFAVNKIFFNRLYTQLAFNAVTADLDYDNFRISNAESFSQKISGRMGYAFYPAATLALLPYVTAGYQHWQLDTGGLVAGNYNIDGETKFFQNSFYGVGLLGEWAASPRLVFSIDTMIGKLVHPWVRFNAPHITVDEDGTQLIAAQQADLTAPPFYQVGIGGDYLLRQHLHLRMGLNYHFSKINNVATNPSQLEQPLMRNSNLAYSLGLAYSFDEPNSVSTLGHYDNGFPILRANNQVGLLYSLIDQNYGETVPQVSHYIDRQQGAGIHALGIVLTKTIENIYTQVNMNMAAGNTAYKGSFLSGEPYFTSTRNTIYDVNGKIGYMFSSDMEKYSVTPYVTGGFHRWLRDFNGVEILNFKVNAYPETYQHLWYGAGALLQWAATPKWVLSLDGSVGTTASAEMKSWNSFHSPYTIKQTFDLGARPTYSLGLGSDYALTKNWHLLAQVNYLRFGYGCSFPSSLDILEPESRTRQFTTSIGFGYSFD
jgi:hypothetical protein